MFRISINIHLTGGDEMWKFDHVRLREVRKSKGLTLRQAEELIGTSYQLIAMWESGQSTPSTASIVKVCNAYKVVPGYFFIQDVHNDDEQPTGDEQAA